MPISRNSFNWKFNPQKDVEIIREKQPILAPPMRNTSRIANTSDVVAFLGAVHNDFKANPIKHWRKQYSTTTPSVMGRPVTVKNNMDEGTSVHWHGLEIDSWADGVPQWSSSDGRSSPIIEPGDSFTYKLSTMRPGTFVYHSHLDDVRQLTQGLYGPMIVIGENEVYHPELDHFYMMGWKTSFPGKPEDLDLNGWEAVPDQHAKIGETHRLRLINIAPAGNGWIRMTKDDEIIPIKAIAKDGADFPLPQQHEVEVTPRLYVGETADYSFTPAEPGVYTLKVNYMMARWEQTWIVAAQ